MVFSSFYHFSRSGRSRLGEQRHQKWDVVDIFNMRSNFFNPPWKFSLEIITVKSADCITENREIPSLTLLVRSKATGALCSVLSVT